MANTPYYTKAETDAIEANLRRQYNYGASEYQGYLAIADTPTLDGWYWATQIGTYTNAGGLVTVANKINMIEKDGVTFRLNAIDVPVTTVVDGFASNSTTSAGSANNDKLLNERTKDIKVLSLDGFYFTDATGNVMFQIAVDGTKSTGYKIIDPATKLEVATLDKAWYDELISTGQSISDIKTTIRTDGFYFTDATGNVLAKLTTDGFQAIKFLNKTGQELGSSPKKLEGKFVVSIGDSHASSPWLSKFCELTGSTYDTPLQNYIQANQYNYTDTGVMMGIAKALNQYCIDNTITPDVILIENSHLKIDGTKPITDYVPMIYDNLSIYPTTYGSISALQSNISADRASFLSTLTPKLKTALRFNYSTFKHTITFSSTGTLTAGTVQLTIDGSVFPINVTTGQTLSQAVTALNDWAINVSSWTNSATKGATRTTTIELIYTGTVTSPASPTVSFSGGGTGMSMTTNVQTSTVAFQDYYFNSFLLSGWNTATNWIATNGTGAYPAMMGLIEYLKSKFPLAEIVVWGVQYLAVSNTPSDPNSYMVETFAGSGVYNRNIHLLYQNAGVAAYLKSKEAMRISAEYYNTRFIDVDANCGINIFNMFDGYFASNNLHPLTLGYNKWGQTLAELY